MTFSPKVSVIVPSYNRGFIILRSLKSISEQTYTNLEIIVVDDGSVDNTFDIVSQYDDPRVVYIKHNKNMGLSSARNTGIKASSGEIIAFQDTDDIWLKNKLKEHIEAFESTIKNIYVVYSGSYRYKNHKKDYIPYKYILPKEGDVFKKLLGGNFIPAISLCARRECFEKVGLFDPILHSLEDWEMWIRLSKRYKFTYIPKPLNLIYYTEDSLSANLNNFLKAEQIIVKKHFESFSLYPSLLSKQYGQIGIYHALQGNKSGCFDNLYKAMKTSKIYSILYHSAKILGVDLFLFFYRLFMTAKKLLR